MATTDARVSRATGPDRLTVMMLSIAGFLAMLAILAWQMRAAPARPARSMIVLRRIYETRVVETVVGSSGRGTSVTQSVSSSAGQSSSPASAATRSS